ncbi:MAG TPA: hypothetical protein VNK03_06885 [Gammaproteobacteria bacterium]|nr:hypothetical protein [Gammaproteobacteria bacterium]
MNDKKLDKHKISSGSWKDALELLAHVVFAICVVYVIYGYFHQKDIENDLVEKKKIEKIEKESQASGGYRIKSNNLNLKS